MTNLLVLPSRDRSERPRLFPLFHLPSSARHVPSEGPVRTREMQGSRHRKGFLGSRGGTGVSRKVDRAGVTSPHHRLTPCHAASTSLSLSGERPALRLACSSSGREK